MTLTTSYLGLELAHPFILGASPVTGNLDNARRAEDGGCAAIVMHSLFEEQIVETVLGKLPRLPIFICQRAPNSCCDSAGSRSSRSISRSRLPSPVACTV